MCISFKKAQSLGISLVTKQCTSIKGIEQRIYPHSLQAHVGGPACWEYMDANMMIGMSRVQEQGFEIKIGFSNIKAWTLVQLKI